MPQSHKWSFSFGENGVVNFSMSGYSIPVAMCSVKLRPRHFVFGWSSKNLWTLDSWISSVIAHGLFLPQVPTLYESPCQDRWKVALFRNKEWLLEVCLHILKEHDRKMCSELQCFGLLNLVTTGICNLYLKWVCRVLWTVDHGTLICWALCLVDFFGLWINAAQSLST